MGHKEFHGHYLGDPHLATHERHQSAVPLETWLVHKPVHHQLSTGHNLASYLHPIKRQQSLCTHCTGDDERAQHLLLRCLSLMQAHTSTNYVNSTDHRCTWSFLESNIAYKHAYKLNGQWICQQQTQCPFNRIYVWSTQLWWIISYLCSSIPTIRTVNKNWCLVIFNFISNTHSTRQNLLKIKI